MQRVPNWNVALGALAREVLGQPFEWGVTDCVTIARRAIEAQFGEDITAPHIDVTYTTKTGAVRAHNKIGSMADVALAAGAAEIPVEQTRDGDIMIFPKSRGFGNILTLMGGMWIMSDPYLDKVVPMKIAYTSLNPEVRAFRF
jgi:hypothetical protein